MPKYVEKRDNGFFAAGTRISLDSVIAEYQRGSSPEKILKSYPMIGSLSKVRGSIEYYLAHKADVDDYLEAGRKLSEKMRAEQALPPGIKRRMEQARRNLTSPAS